VSCAPGPLHQASCIMLVTLDARPCGVPLRAPVPRHS
jgi:hypothetical protein